MLNVKHGCKYAKLICLILYVEDVKITTFHYPMPLKGTPTYGAVLDVCDLTLLVTTNKLFLNDPWTQTPYTHSPNKSACELKSQL